TTLSFVPEGGASGHIACSSDSGRSLRVTAVRLKTRLQDEIDLLKMDIEGAEYEVLDDCREELKNVKNLFVEYHSRADLPQRLSSLLQILSDAGFRYHIREAFTSSHPFLRRARLGGMDLQLNIFCFRP